MKRREFVASVAAAAHVGASATAGKPVRETPLRSRSWGPLFYDEAERREVAEVIETRRPFRFGGGPNPPVKAATS